ncbi:anthranilate synthase family protein [Lentzea sp. JNUCC 0626]|uniref:anthranilate synthase family protein n=1 Tax=Lentzea sp. JNUCC 0626 TaxID=3367513 RepID=UPI003748C156
MNDLLNTVLASADQPFALVHRPRPGAPERLEVFVGDVAAVPALADIPQPAADLRTGPQTFVIMPFRQVTERGLPCVDDQAPLLVMNVRGHTAVPLDDALNRLPDDRIRLSAGDFDVDDDGYADVVRQVIADDIGGGEGANFVIRRSFVAEIEDYRPELALALFRRLCSQESGYYWAFVLHTGDRTFVGASPERHVSLENNVLTMNPISGTHRYPPGGPTLPGLLDFLADHKEIDELYMVLDEELKMMSRICAKGVQVVGPRLKEMARLAHTEYLIEGRCDLDVREILRETMFAPTVTGSPVENACRVISKYEQRGRGYYSGVVALIGHDRAGHQTMDSAILIRTAEIDRRGRVEIGVGATLVRHSDPVSEAAETRLKAAALLSALQDSPARWDDHPDVRTALRARNARLGTFWFTGRDNITVRATSLSGKRALVIDAEDTFTSMIAYQLRSLGLTVDVQRYGDAGRTDLHDLVVLGPGPGNPTDREHAKIQHLHDETQSLLGRHQPFLSVCLSHQILCGVLGLDLIRRDAPNQGVRREIDLFGAQQVVGFYNTFAARSPHDKLEHQKYGLVEFSRDTATGEVHAVRGDGFASVQFHPESVLTSHGPLILTSLIEDVLATQVPPQCGP